MEASISEVCHESPYKSDGSLFLRPNAMKLARQTVIGSAALAEAESNTPAAILRENVTSPGGTTAAALDVLMNGELQNIFDEALAAATSRSKELSS